MACHSYINARYGKVIILAVIGILLIGCPASPPPDTDLRNGFRGIAWGSSFKDIEGMTMVKEHGDRFVLTTNDPEQLKIGEVDVDKIEYKFIDNAFSGVEIRFSGYTAFKGLNRELESAWGPADLENYQVNEMVWRLDGVAVKLNYYRMPDSGTLILVRNR